MFGLVINFLEDEEECKLWRHKEIRSSTSPLVAIKFSSDQNRKPFVKDLNILVHGKKR